MSQQQFRPPHIMSIAELNVDVKDALRFTLTHRTTLKHLRDGLQAEGIAIASRDETLRKFVSIPDRHLDNVEDLFRLYHFFHRTTEGRLLRRPRGGATTAIDRLLVRLITPAYYIPHVTVTQDIVGSYLCYHFEDDRAALCAVRAMCITSPSRGLFEFEEFRDNPKGIRIGRGLHSYPAAPQEYFGVVLKANNALQFLATSTNVHASVRAMTAFVSNSDARIAIEMNGWVSGFDIHGRVAHRPVYIERIADEARLHKDRSFLETFDSLSPNHLSTPERLCSSLPEQKCSSDASKKAADIGGLLAFRASSLSRLVG